MKEEKTFFWARQLFEDLDQWINAFKTWNLRSTQLSQGKFKRELAIVQFAGFQIIYTSPNQAIHIIGNKPHNTFSFSISLSLEDEILIAHDKGLSHNVLFGKLPSETLKNH